MANFDTDYKFSPRIREIIEAKRGKKMGLTHAQAEFLIRDIFLDKYKGDYKFNEEDKKKILFYLVDFDPNKYDKEDLDNLSKFFLNAFTKEEVIDFVTNLTKKSYFPGRVLYNIRVLNENITYFISLFPNYFKMYKGIIINTKFIGDIKKIYPNVIFNEETGEITDEKVQEHMNDFIKMLKSTHKKNLKISIKDDVYVFASSDEKVIEDLGTYKLNVEDVPEFYFTWK
jgi:hypothetical protein